MVAARCQALQELELTGFELEQPATPLAPLTRLCLTSCIMATADGAAPLTSLAAAAPRLEALSWGQSKGKRAAAAVEGCPCLKELRLSFAGPCPYAKVEAAWLHTAQRLPALATLEIQVRPAGRAHIRLWRMCERLSGCQRLVHLDLAVLDGSPVNDILAAIGAAKVGGRLRSLTLSRSKLPPTREAAGGGPATNGTNALPSPRGAEAAASCTIWTGGERRPGSVAAGPAWRPCPSAAVPGAPGGAGCAVVL